MRKLVPVSANFDTSGVPEEILSQFLAMEPDIAPGASHSLTLEKPDVVNRLILDFLQDRSPTIMLLRRAAAGALAG